MLRYVTQKSLHSIRNNHAITARFLSSTTTTSNIGFIGLGNMGLPMCQNLIEKTNHNFLVNDLNPTSITTITQNNKNKNVESISSLPDLAQKCNIIFTMLPGCAASTSVLTELMPNVQPKTIFVDCSTVSPITSKSLHGMVSSHHCFMLDAPVSGGVRGAKDGTLTFMVGGSTETLECIQPLLQNMGKNIFHCGDATAGAAVKLCNNLALATQMIGICEAMNLGDELGVSPLTLAEVMNKSTAGCWSCSVNNPHPEVGEIASKGYEGGFGAKLMLKDLGLAVSAGESVGVPLPLGGSAKELYRLVEQRGLSGKDFGVMLQFLRGK